MDIGLASATFATVVSLVADFVAHRASHQSKTIDDFNEWLASERHDEVKALLERSADTTISIKALLSKETKDIQKVLGSLDESLAMIAASFEEFRDIAIAVHPSSEISAQAEGILREFSLSQASKALLSDSMSGSSLITLDGDQHDFTIDEVRFLLDDLTTLVRLRLLDLYNNSHGEPVYVFTRAAQKFIENRGRLPPS